MVYLDFRAMHENSFLMKRFGHMSLGDSRIQKATIPLGQRLNGMITVSSVIFRKS